MPRVSLAVAGLGVALWSAGAALCALAVFMNPAAEMRWELAHDLPNVSLARLAAWSMAPGVVMVWLGALLRRPTRSVAQILLALLATGGTASAAVFVRLLDHGVLRSTHDERIGRVEIETRSAILEGAMWLRMVRIRSADAVAIETLSGEGVLRTAGAGRPIAIHIERPAQRGVLLLDPRTGTAARNGAGTCASFDTPVGPALRGSPRTTEGDPEELTLFGEPDAQGNGAPTCVVRLSADGSYTSRPL